MVPLSDRAYIRGEHPPSCTCTKCVNERLRRLRKEAHPSYISICPICHRKSLWWNSRGGIYECLNLSCKVTGRSITEIADRYIPSERTLSPLALPTVKRSKPKKPKLYKMPSQLITLLLILALSITGLGISIFTGSAIPFYLLLGLSVLYIARKQILPAILVVLIVLVVTSTISMVWPQGITKVTPKELEILRILLTRVDAQAIEQSILLLINQERQKAGLTPLLWDDRLAEYSKKHSTNMARVGGLYHDEAELAQLQAGENALMISKFSGGFILLPYPIGLALYKTDLELSQESVNAWMGSPGHRSNILMGNYRYTGIGVAVAKDGITCYITQNFR